MAGDINKNFNIFANFVPNKAIQGIDRLKSSMKGLNGVIGYAAGGLAFLDLTKRAIKLDSELIKLRQSGDLTAEAMIALKKQVFSVALATHTTTDGVLSMSTAALNASHNLKFVTTEMKFMSQMANASGMDMGSLGGYLGDLQRESGLTGEAFKTMVGKLVSLSHMPGVISNFSKLAPQMSGMTRTFLTQGGDPKKLFNFLGMSMFSSHPENLAAGLKQAVQKVKWSDLNLLGLNQNDVLNFDLKKIVGQIDKVTSNPAVRATLLSGVLGGGNLVDVENIVKNWDKVKEGLGNATVADALALADEKAKGLEGSLNVLKTIGDKFADSALTPMLKDLAKIVDKLATDPNLDNYLAWVKNIGIAFATWKIVSGVGKELGLLGSLMSVVSGGAGGKKASPYNVLGDAAGKSAYMKGGAGGAALAMGWIPMAALGTALGLGAAKLFEMILDRIKNPTANKESGLSTERNVHNPNATGVVPSGTPYGNEIIPDYSKGGFMGPPAPSMEPASILVNVHASLKDENGQEKKLKVVKKQMTVTKHATQSSF